jgi:hypothetical protein
LYLEKSHENGSVVNTTEMAKDSWKVGQNALIEPRSSVVIHLDLDPK